MRTSSGLLLLMILLVLPGRVVAQQANAGDGLHARKTITSPAVAKENWTELKDLTTGLETPVADVLETTEQADYVRELVRVEWRVADPIELWIVRPKAAAKVPVILYLYGYLDTGTQFRDNGWGKRVTSGGFAAVGFVSALTDYRFRFRPMKQWFVSELAESLGTTAHDVQLILNYLATRGDMNMDQVGMFGMGSGASIAILAASVDPRIKTLDLLDPWGDWPDWLQKTPVMTDDERSKLLTPEFLKSLARLDPVTYLPSLAGRKLRLQQTLSEPETPKNAKDGIAAAVPKAGQLVQYASANDLMKAWQNAGLSGWIKQQILAQPMQSAGQVTREGSHSTTANAGAPESNKESGN